MDNWFWCPSRLCGVTQWFKFLGDGKYECSHCHEVVDMAEYTKKYIGGSHEFQKN